LLVLDSELLLEHERLSTLTVDLQKLTHGVYNTRGRAFVYQKLQRTEERNRPQEADNEISEWLKHPSSKKIISLEGAPLLWCGAGVIPIVKFRRRPDEKDEYWCMLFFRDTVPVCQAPMVGGAEEEKERLFPEKLVIREFCEEAVIVSLAPKRDGKVEQLKFAIEGLRNIVEGEKLADKVLGLKYTERYRKYRRKREKVFIERRDNPKSIRVVQVGTSFEIIVKDEAGEKDPANDVFITVNPGNSAIDCFMIAYFELGTHYPIFGEMREEGYPQRSPIVLFKLDFLRDIYEKGGNAFKALQTVKDPKLYREGRKICDEFPDGSYFLFDKDLELSDKRKTDLIEKQKKRTAWLNNKWLKRTRLSWFFELKGVELRELAYLESRGTNVDVNRGELLDQVLKYQAEGKGIQSDAITEPFFVFGGTVWRPLEIAFRDTCLRTKEDFEEFVRTKER
jgi:hypothetical protein